MTKLEFDKKIFIRRYAIYYSLAQCFFLPGFLFIIAAILLPVKPLSLPSAIATVFGVYSMSSFVGFPLITIVKKGMKTLVSNSKVELDENKIYYDRLKERISPLSNGIEEWYIYRGEKITSIQEKRRYYYVTGDIHLKIINNRRVLKKKVITKMKIPNAYRGMERMIRDK